MNSNKLDPANNSIVQSNNPNTPETSTPTTGRVRGRGVKQKTDKKNKIFQIFQGNFFKNIRSMLGGIKLRSLFSCFKATKDPEEERIKSVASGRVLDQEECEKNSNSHSVTGGSKPATLHISFYESAIKDAAKQTFDTYEDAIFALSKQGISDNSSKNHLYGIFALKLKEGKVQYYLGYQKRSSEEGKAGDIGLVRLKATKEGISGDLVEKRLGLTNYQVTSEGDLTIGKQIGTYACMEDLLKSKDINGIWLGKDVFKPD